ncbi:hypothetical protein ACOSP7_017297 [Xanthoceras sorbifolium]
MHDPAWYADSRATTHVTSDLGNLSHYSQYEGLHKLVVGSGQKLAIDNVGTSLVKSHTQPTQTLQMTNVLHVLQVTKNLLSISTFTRDNHAVAEFHDNCCVIKDKTSKKVLLQGTLKDALYQLKLHVTNSKLPCLLSADASTYLAHFHFDHCNKNTVIASKNTVVPAFTYSVHFASTDLSNTNSTSTALNYAPCVANFSANNVASHSAPCVDNIASIWHSKLGHPSLNVLKQVLQSVRIRCPVKQPLWCDSCKIGKLHQLPFSNSTFTASTPLELVFTDIWGPSPINSTAGHKYYILFVDSFTRYTWLFPLKLKSEALSTFVSFKSQVEKQFERPIKVL